MPIISIIYFHNRQCQQLRFFSPFDLSDVRCVSPVSGRRFSPPESPGGRAGFRLRLQPVMNGCFQADASRGQVSFSLASFAGRTVFPVEIDPFSKPSCFPAHLHLPSGTCGAAVCGHVESVRQTAAMQQKMYKPDVKTGNKSVPG